MQSIHFSVRPYRNYKNEISNEFIYLCLVKNNGDVVKRQSIRTDAWRNNENGCREYWKHELLTYVKDALIRASKASEGGYIYKKETRLILDDATYDDWYRWYYFIDGEDAYEYISRCSVSQHTTNWQARCGVVVGWKFYKKLREHDFNESTSAMLAYARGYLYGMEFNSPWGGEGMEALHCLGLDIEGGSDALRKW